MLTNTESALIDQCKRRIEEKMGWGASETWSAKDFEDLSASIFGVTAVALSPTTLKRIWGKVKYDSAPTLTTLNTLAQFVGYSSWRDFRRAQPGQSDGPPNHLPQIKDPVLEKKTRRPVPPRTNSYAIGAALVSVGLVAVVFGYLLIRKSRDSAKIPVGNYQFTIRKILNVGVPNSVIFDYDAHDAPMDSVFIQQSWDPALSAQVAKNQTEHTSIYYYPGFFQAKLRVGSLVVKEHSVSIQTDGWLRMIEQKPVPIYFSKGHETDPGMLTITRAEITANNVALQPDPPIVRFSNVGAFGELKTDGFVLETSLRNTYEEGSNICQKSELMILCEGSMIYIPLSAKGCISENNLFCLGTMVKGSEHDLSGFGVNFKQFVHLRVEMRKGSAKFFVDNKLAYQLDGQWPSSKIVGITYRFKGTGAVDWVKLMSPDGTLVYADNF